MTHGKPIISDLAVLEHYAKPFNERPSFRLFAFSQGLAHKQLYSQLSKHRFYRWLNYGMCLENGWLTEEGKDELARLQGLQAAPPVPLGGDL